MRKVGISGCWCEVKGETNSLRMLTGVFKCKYQTYWKASPFCLSRTNTAQLQLYILNQGLAFFFDKITCYPVPWLLA